MRRCTRCLKEKSLENFYPKLRPSGKQDYAARCKICQNALREEYYAKNPEKKVLTNRRSQLTKYGITPKDFDRLYAAQSGRCTGCGIHQSELDKRISVDHCHTTKEVRGLLCQPCNMILGLAKDDVNTLNTLVKYLLKHKSELADQNTSVVEGNFPKKVG